MIWFAVLFAPTLLTAAMLLERLERQLLVSRAERDDHTDLATVLHIAYPHIADHARHTG